MIKPRCSVCNSELDTPGGLLLGVPDDDDRVTKAHLCAAHTPTPDQLARYLALDAARESLQIARERARAWPTDAAIVAQQAAAWVTYRGELSALGAQSI
jgi:hypothetical protein